MIFKNYCELQYSISIDFNNNADRFYDDYDDQETGLLKRMKSETEMMILNNQN